MWRLAAERAFSSAREMMQAREPEITPKQRVILEELTAEAEKHGVGY